MGSSERVGGIKRATVRLIQQAAGRVVVATRSLSLSLSPLSDPSEPAKMNPIFAGLRGSRP